MSYLLPSALVYQTNTNGQIFRNKILYFFFLTSRVSQFTRRICQYDLNSLLTTIKGIKFKICPISYFSNNLTEVDYMRSLK